VLWLLECRHPQCYAPGRDGRGTTCNPQAQKRPRPDLSPRFSIAERGCHRTRAETGRRIQCKAHSREHEICCLRKYGDLAEIIALDVFWEEERKTIFMGPIGVRKLTIYIVASPKCAFMSGGNIAVEVKVLHLTDSTNVELAKAFAEPSGTRSLARAGFRLIMGSKIQNEKAMADLEQSDTSMCFRLLSFRQPCAFRHFRRKIHAFTLPAPLKQAEERATRLHLPLRCP
jgi:hypothetical protein